MVVKVGVGVTGDMEEMVVEAASAVEGMAEVVAVNMEVLVVNMEDMEGEKKVVT